MQVWHSSNSTWVAELIWQKAGCSLFYHGCALLEFVPPPLQNNRCFVRQNHFSVRTRIKIPWLQTSSWVFLRPNVPMTRKSVCFDKKTIHKTLKWDVKTFTAVSHENRRGVLLWKPSNSPPTIMKLQFKDKDRILFSHLALSVMNWHKIFIGSELIEQLPKGHFNCPLLLIPTSSFLCTSVQYSQQAVLFPSNADRNQKNKENFV